MRRLLGILTIAGCVGTGVGFATEPGAAPPPDQADQADQAIAAYESGRWADALALLAGIDAAGQADGPTLYRLYYCRRELNDPAARETAVRARERLEAEYGATPDLETGFYLANAMRNVGRLSDAERIGAEVTGNIDSGTFPPPATPIETFQLGKLYADQGRNDQASIWYSQALEQLPEYDGKPSASAGWAARFLAERAFTVPHWPSVERYYTIVDRAGTATQEDLDRLAIAQVRLAQYQPATATWYKALRLNPAGGDRARYCAQLAFQASGFESVPTGAADGRAWSVFSPDELAQYLLEQAQFATITIEEAKTSEESMTDERRAEVAGQLEEAHRLFVGAALEFVMRGLPIRETAFQAGYAPLVFHGERWNLPPPTAD